MFGIEAPRGSDALVRQSLDCLLGIAPRDAGLGVLSGRSLSITSPRAEAPDFAKPTSRLAFWRHLPQHEGRHSFSDGGLGYSVRPLCGRKKTSKLQGRDGARPSRGKMVRNHHWILDQDLEGARSLGAALLDAGEDARFAF